MRITQGRVGFSSRAVNRPQINEDFRIFYETIPPGTDTRPTNTGVYGPILAKYAPTLAENWFPNNSVYWQADNFSTGTQTDRLTFNSISDLVTYKNENIAVDQFNNFETVAFRAYDDIDNQLPVISKVYGMNRFYSGLKGKNSYKSGAPSLENLNTDNWQESASLLQQMFNHFNSTLAPFADTSDFHTQNGLRTFWTTRNHLKMYDFPPTGISFTLEIDSGRRRTSNENWEGLGSFGANQNDTYSYTNQAFVSYNGNDTNGSISIIDVASAGDERNVRNRYLNDTNTSMIVMYDVRSTNLAVGDRKFAIYLKPYGVDTIYINWFDQTRYDLEVCYYFENLQKTYFRRVTNLIRIDPNGDTIGVPKDQWMPQTSSHNQATLNGGQFKPPQILFRLRSKATRKVSRFSQAALAWNDSGAGNPGHYRVI